MKLSLVDADLGRFGAQIVEVEGGLLLTGASGRQFGAFKAPPDPLAFAGTDFASTPTPGWTVQYGLRTLAELDHAEIALARDQRLSDFGREERLKPVREGVAKTLASVLTSLEENARGLDAQEAQRYAVAPLREGDIIGALQDGEVRNWVRSLSGEERSALYEQLGAGEDSALLRAVLRSPVKLGNLEKVALEGWRARIDRDDPDGRAHLELARNSIEWARGALGAVRGILMPRLKYSRAQLYATVGKAGAPHFGFSPTEIEQHERIALARRAAA